MYSAITAVTTNLKEFDRALVTGQQSLSDLQSGQDAPIRGVPDVDNANGTSKNNGADQARQSLGAAAAATSGQAGAGVDGIAAKTAANASVALVQSQEETLGSLLDIVA
jgi:hypothetical protein